MMFKGKKKAFSWAFLLSISFAGVSCVDSKYDLDGDVDMTINVGGEHLAIPVGSTKQAFLSDLIEVEEGDMLQPDKDTRIYHLTKKDDMDVTPTSVEKVNIEKTTATLTEVSAVATTASSTEVTSSVESTGTFKAKATGIDEALKELGSLRTNTPAVLKLTFDFTKTGTLIYNEVKAIDLKITFPDFLVFEENEKLNGNVLTLDGQTLSSTTKEDFEYELKVVGYQFSKTAGDGKKPDQGALSIEDVVKADGKVKTTGVTNTGGGSLKFTPKAVLQSMAADFVTGVILPNIEVDPTDIELNDLPDFLKDDDVRLDITNPVFAFKATNSLNTPVEIDAVLTPMKGNAVIQGHEVKVGQGHEKDPLVLDPNSETIIALSRLGESSIAGANVKNIKVEDINNVVEIIPDFIKVDLKPVVRNSDYYEAELGKDYEMPSSYDVDIPLSFEKNLNIVYKDTIDDLNKDLADLDQVSFKKANLLLSVTNAIPLKLELKADNVIIQDVDGNELTSITKNVPEGSGIVSESKDGATPVDGELKLELATEEAGVLSKIDKIIFKITGVPGEATGVPLKDSQWMQVTNIKLNVPNGINVDLN